MQAANCCFPEVSVTYWHPWPFLFLEKDKSGLGASYFVRWNTLGLCSCNCRVKRCVIAVCFSLATVILPSLQRCLQRVVAKGANKNHVKSCQIMSNHVIHVNLCHPCQIISFMSNHVIHVKSCHSGQIMSFMSNHVIHVNLCHSCQIMSFMSNHVIHVMVHLTFPENQ
jgi:hypothetical protein